MRPRFSEKKTAEAAALLLSLRGGLMSYMKLIKLLYIVDREALLSWGRPVTYDAYVSMDKGPVLSRTLSLITDGTEPGRQSDWNALISEPDHYEVHLRHSEFPTGELSDAEVQLIRHVFGQYGHLSRWELVDFVHGLPEWQDPEGSVTPISYADILAAGDRTEAEIRAIEDELEFLAMTDSILT